MKSDWLSSSFLTVLFVSVFLPPAYAATTSLPGDLQFVAPASLPTHATWFSLQGWGKYPPSPVNWCAGRTDVVYYHSPSYSSNNIVIDDTSVDYLQEVSTTPQLATATLGGGGAMFGPLVSYSSNDFWLQPIPDTNHVDQVSIIAHGVTNGLWQLNQSTQGFCQLLTKTNLDHSPWSLGPILFDDGTAKDLVFSDVVQAPPETFFRGVVGTNVASIVPLSTLAIEPDASGNGAQNASFQIFLQSQNIQDVTVVYQMSGTANPGVDYSNFPGTLSGALSTVTVPAFQQSVVVNVQPLHDPKIDFDEPAIFTLVVTNGILVDPTAPSATLTISDNFGLTNIFDIVATNIPNPVGIDYNSANQSLILPINYVNNDPNFGILHTNGALTNWSGLRAINPGREPRIFTVKTTSNGLTAGDLLFGNGEPGGIGWLSANGAVSNLNWITITNEPNLIEGIYIDQTGIWSNDVLAVSGSDDSLSETNLNVWRIHTRTNAPQLAASIPTSHLEGLLTLSNDTRYGPWAGKLLTADENEHSVLAVDIHGAFTTHFLSINADTIRLIPTNQDLYCIDFRPTDPDHSQVIRLSRNYFAPFTGDILMVQAGEVPPDFPALVIVHWNGAWFETHTISLNDYFPAPDFFEKAAFAPMILGPVSP